MYDIPEKDKVCVNCLHFGSASRTGNIDKCGGQRPCVNYAVGNTKNYFVPDDWYLSDRFGCKACAHYTEDCCGEHCKECSRHYEDRWERRTEND